MATTSAAMFEYVGPAKVVGLPEGDISAEAFEKLTPELKDIVKKSGVYRPADEGKKKGGKPKPEGETDPK